MKTELELKKNEFIKRNQFKNKIVEIIKDYIEINNQKHYLKSLICTPIFNNFTALIIWEISKTRPRIAWPAA